MENYTYGIDYARDLDQKDPLAKVRERFYLLPGTIYMDGNSCGLCSVEAEQALLHSLEAWKKNGFAWWDQSDEKGRPYSKLAIGIGQRLAGLIGARPDEVAVSDTTTINIHQCLATFYHPTAQRYKILVDELNFPTDRYVVDSQVALHGLDAQQAVKVVKSRDGRMIEEDDIIAAMTDDVAVAFFPSVYYRSAQLLDMKRVAAAAKERGIIVGFDLCHSIGVVDHNFEEIEPDFAVWCNYKYISGGPGAMAALYINRRHFDRGPGLAGWQGNRQDTKMDFLNHFEHEKNATGWQLGTLSLFSMASLSGALDIYSALSMEQVREKSLRITRYLMQLIDERLTQFGFSVGNPRDDARRGGHVALEHEQARRISELLMQKGVVPDFRPPNVIRLAPVPVYISYEDVFHLVEILEEIGRSL